MAFQFDLNLNDTFGAYTLGTFASSILFGVTCFQTYHYFNTYTDDGIFLKLTVITVSGFEMLHVGFSIHAVYHYLITDYLSPLSLLRPVWFRLRSLLELPGLPETLAKISLSTAVAIDVTIAATLSYFLHSSRTGIKQTDKLINRLMKYTINNGVLTTVFDIITLTLVITRPRDLIFLAFSQVLASLYSNSFLATLNSRRPPASSHAVVNSNGISLQTIHFGAVPGAMVNSDSTSSPIENDSHKDRIARLAAEQVV
ncbi:hypothetical protein JR316_0005567 [Psilocybe cubensis]|uniref:Uncharacterized protein n=1 Tax=Psilocybe cubensis TaxID=181762 RepID=A0ACB8GZU5_PSICU|nr:hypothetical protein JR316_0005567 [Psilocybe cubensis]KAH9481048.1 hypothetical protein JR316_0005567 [Psilocybe cubensis]